MRTNESLVGGRPCAWVPAHRENTISRSLARFLDGRVRVALTCHLLSCELKRPQTGAGRMVRTSVGICVHPAVEEAVVGGGAA